MSTHAMAHMYLNMHTQMLKKVIHYNKYHENVYSYILAAIQSVQTFKIQTREPTVLSKDEP